MGPDDRGLTLRYRQSQPASIVLRRACRAVPELVEAEAERNELAAEIMARGLRHRFAHLSDERILAASRVMVLATASLLDHVSEHPEIAETTLPEIERLFRSYLAAMAEGTERSLRSAPT